MQTNPDAALAVQPELTPGESLIWAGMPNPGRILHKHDLFLIPFSLLWAGAALFAEASFLGFGGNNSGRNSSAFGVIWGMVFVVLGQYVVWGRFFHVAWKKRRTFYALTNRRVIVLQNGLSRTLASAYLDTLPMLIKEDISGTNGTLKFSLPPESRRLRRRSSAWDTMSIGAVPAFVDVDDVDELYRLIAGLRDTAAANRPSTE